MFRESRVRKILGWSFGLVVVLLVGIFAAQMIASETGEVVVLHTRDAAGETTTRLWVVEHDGDLWLRQRRLMQPSFSRQMMGE